MHPEFWTVPLINYTIKSYGLMLMIGFLSAVYLAAKRAEKVRVDPDVVINLGFFALIGGVAGARIFYVVHYWDRYFAGSSNPLLAVLDVTRGGMEFLGGVIGAIALIVPYLLIKRASLRLYLDILTPGLMWGLAFGRIGCFLNGCCWGGICENTVASHWGVSFPFSSPCYVRQYQNRQIDVPAPLLFVNDVGQAMPIDRQLVNLEPQQRNAALRRLEDAKEVYERLASLEPDSDDTKEALRRVERLKKKALEEQMTQQPVNYNLRMYPSLEFPGQTMTYSEFTGLAASQHSRKVHPVQLYASINAFLASIFLAAVFRIRKRHGVVFAVFLMTYPICRLVLELIRVDNPKDSFGLTVSQFVSLTMIALGVIMYAMLRKMPLRSPRAVAWEPEPVKS